jgi:glycosyltransferase involved in cell wall biosynthesis
LEAALRILLLTRSLNIGGAERQLVNLAKKLHDRGHEVAVATFYGNGVLEKELRDANVPVINLRKSGRWDVLAFFIRLIRLVSKSKPDVIYGFLGTANVLTALIKPFVSKSIKMIWSVRASNMQLNHYDRLALFSYRLECWLSQFAHVIISNSAAGRDHAAKNGFPLSKILVIPNGIDTNVFKADPIARRRARQEWGIAEHEKLIAIVARLDPMKDVPCFLRAASQLIRERSDVRFVCVGDGPQEYRTKLNRLAEELGLSKQLIWAGARKDMLNVFSALDIAVSSSLFGEGFSNSIAEAMSCGVPCVVTDVGDSALIVGEWGEVVPPGSPDAIHAALKVTLTQLSAELSDAVRASLVSRFSVDALVDKTVLAIRT